MAVTTATIAASAARNLPAGAGDGALRGDGNADPALTLYTRRPGHGPSLAGYFWGIDARRRSAAEAIARVIRNAGAELDQVRTMLPVGSGALRALRDDAE